MDTMAFSSQAGRPAQSSPAQWPETSPVNRPSEKHPTVEALGAHYQNVGEAERWLSLLGGVGLVGLGLARGGFTGWTIAALGGALAFRGTTGHCQLYSMLGIDAAAIDRSQKNRPPVRS